MRIWITGGAGSGKSALAQELAAALAAGGPKYYIATMIPRDGEDRSRIRRHIEDRAGMGFVTIECPCRLMERIEPDPEGTCLLDSATALLSNAMFGEREFVYRPDAAREAADDLLTFASRVGNLIAVSDGIYSDAVRYDGMTEQYRRGLAWIERRMAEEFDTVLECAAGGVIVHKGEMPAGIKYGGRKTVFREESRMQLIIGGAYQGKREYAKARFRLQETDIYTCTEEEEPDFSAGCLDHLELYLRRCAVLGTEPVAPDAFRADAVLICEDITCGVVPVDKTDRKWRELTGRFWQELARAGAEVTRVFCGFGQKLERAGGDRPRQILLLRHGKTRANEEHLYCGSTDLPLCEAGRQYLQQRAGKYGSGWQAFYTSGKERTGETLRLLFGGDAWEARIERPGLAEMDFGRFEGRSYEQLREEPEYQKWISGDNERNVCPGGESGERMRGRVIAEFDRILQSDPSQCIVIVTHGGPIAAIMQELFPDQRRSRYEWQPACGEGYLLKVWKDGRTAYEETETAPAHSGRREDAP